MDTPARILIVDDDPTVRETLRSCFAGEGYEIAFAADGSSALAQAAAWMPDLVLLDVMMPGMDGFEVCRRLRADPLLAQVPVILVTGLDDYDSRIQGAEAGADDFVSKPYSRVELRARVRTITRLNRYRRLFEERERRKEAEDKTRKLNEELQQYTKTLEMRVAERTNELRAERDRTQAILESLGEAVVVVDARQTIQYVNPAFTRLTGYARQEVEGQKVHWWRALYHTTQAFDQLAYAVYNGEVRTGEVVGRRADGRLYDAMLTVAPLFEPQSSSLSGFVGVSHDITPLKEANRLKDQFVSNVSHELRTPLSVITMMVGNLDLFYDRLDDRRRREMIRDLRTQARLLNDLIGDILELSRIDSQRGPLEWTTLDLTQLVRAEFDKQRGIAEEKGHTMILDVAEAITVQGNERQLGQVVRNLVNNAIKYTPPGGQITCVCRLLTADGLLSDEWPGSEQLEGGIWAALAVRDTGVGIAAEHLPHIFERFYRIEMQSNVSGTGLGLSIVKGLVELHRGYVGVTSTPGEGSTFAVYLPMKKLNRLS